MHIVHICCISVVFFWHLGYGGKSELDQAKVDMVVDCFDDMAKPLIAVFTAKTEEEKVKNQETRLHG